MVTGVGIVVLLLGLFAWIGQSVAFFAPSLAVRLGLLEPVDEVDPSLRIIEAKAEGLADMCLAWTLPVAALLMLIDHALWPYFAIFGAGVYLYFSLLITSSRVFLRSAGRRVGSPGSVRAAYTLGGLWGASAIAMLFLAVRQLQG